MKEIKNSNWSHKIVKFCKRLHKKNMLAAADGNVSVKLSDDQILITPSGVMKAFMDEKEMAVINLAGDILQGKPSSEMLMHLQVYRQAPQAKVVIHAHPPYAIAWSIAHPEMSELPGTAMSELILACGKIPIVPFAIPGTEQMAHHLQDFLPHNKVMILARHGALTWGQNLEEAYRGMERLEHSAQILTIAHQLGGVTHLSESVVDQLKDLRKEIVEQKGEVTL